MPRMGITGDHRQELEHHLDGRGSPEPRDPRELSANAELESIVCAYEVWQNGLGWHAVQRDLPLEVHTDSREEMRTKLVGIGKFASLGGRRVQT